MKIEPNIIDIKELDKTKLSYYESYFENNFNSHFEYNLGSDIILNHIANVETANNWIDLGAGASTLFWALPLKTVKNIYCNEVTIEPLYVLNREILNKKELPICYYDVLDIYGHSRLHTDYLKSRMTHFYIFDVMGEWSINQVSFDLITQFGTFGLSKDKETYIKCMNNAFANLSVGGHMIGANWILKERYAKERGIHNHYLDTSIVDRFAKDEKCVVIDNQIVNIVDNNYKGVLIWHLKKE